MENIQRIVEYLAECPRQSIVELNFKRINSLEKNCMLKFYFNLYSERIDPKTMLYI